MDISGASLVTDVFCETVLEGKISVVYCSTAVWPIGGVEPEGGSRVRDTASEHEAYE